MVTGHVLAIAPRQHRTESGGERGVATRDPVSA
jgi:hypothetical protein